MEAIIATVVFAVLSVVCFSVSMLMRREKYASIFAKANPVMPDGRLRYDPQKRLRSGSILLLIYGIVFSQALSQPAAASFCTAYRTGDRMPPDLTAARRIFYKTSVISPLFIP